MFSRMQFDYNSFGFIISYIEKSLKKEGIYNESDFNELLLEPYKKMKELLNSNHNSDKKTFEGYRSLLKNNCTGVEQWIIQKNPEYTSLFTNN